ncbi:MAG TPA: TetR/AcrR family transcriptional regulator [Candidatus Binataceae bacterium]|nr:TetR/AcrR family transcriptional regulator [Candidatus Binataceae bacterium]
MEPAVDTKIDGRRARGERARAAVLDAILDLLQEGDLKPTAERVADRAGVSLRLVFHHFSDLESLYGAAADRQSERLRPLVKRIPSEGAFEDRLEAFLRQRVRLWEKITPVRRASLLLEPFSKAIGVRLQDARRIAREEAAAVFRPEIENFLRTDRADVVAAVDAASAWQTWEVLRRHQKLPIESARRVIARTLSALLAQGK